MLTYLLWNFLWQSGPTPPVEPGFLIIDDGSGEGFFLIDGGAGEGFLKIQVPL